MNKANLSFDDGDIFFCHEMSANFNPTQFVLDFKSVVPLVDPRSKDMPLIRMKHNVVLVEPYHIKMVIELLNKRVKDYEKAFGVIEKPKAVTICEKENKKEIKETVEAPSYVG